MNLGESDGEASVISKDSQPKDDEDDYYEEMQMRAKMKPKKAALKKRFQHKSEIIEDHALQGIDSIRFMRQQKKI